MFVVKVKSRTALPQHRHSSSCPGSTKNSRPLRKKFVIRHPAGRAPLMKILLAAWIVLAAPMAFFTACGIAAIAPHPPGYAIPIAIAIALQATWMLFIASPVLRLRGFPIWCLAAWLCLRGASAVEWSAWLAVVISMLPLWLGAALAPGPALHEVIALYRHRLRALLAHASVSHTPATILPEQVNEALQGAIASINAERCRSQSTEANARDQQIVNAAAQLRTLCQQLPLPQSDRDAYARYCDAALLAACTSLSQQAGSERHA